MKRKAWAIVSNRGHLALHSALVPIYWMRRVAKRDAFPGEQVIRCTVTLDPPKRKGKRK